MRGPIPDIPALLQPVAYALLQAREELEALLLNFPDDLLWEQVAGMASPGFHLQHLTGVLDRLFTYALNRPLTEAQLAYLAAEGKPTDKVYTIKGLTERFNKQVDAALHQLRHSDVSALTSFRGVGRKQLPSTVIGLYTHAAEHTMRHLGQLLVTVKILTAKAKDSY